MFVSLDEEGQEDFRKKKSMCGRLHMGKFTAHVANLKKKTNEF